MQIKAAAKKTIETVKQPDTLRATATLVAARTWANFDGYALIAAGEVASKSIGTPAAATAAASVAIAETLGASYLATKGMGEFQVDVEDSTAKKWGKASLIYSAWAGAPGGVMIDKANGQDITFKRRLAHSVPYGVAIGAWVGTPVPEAAFDAVTHPGESAEWIGDQVQHLAESHTPAALEQPSATDAFGGVGLLAAAGAAVAINRLRNR